METPIDAREKFDNGFFNNPSLWNEEIDTTLPKKITDSINSPLKKRMSDISKGIFYVLNKTTEGNIKEDDEIYLFSGFSEINTTNDIIKSITVNKDRLVSPTLFHNSVHNTPLGYFTIIKGLNNYSTVISDGVLTNLSFINFIKNIVKLGKEIIVATGEEFSNFFLLDRTVNIVQDNPCGIIFRLILPIYLSLSGVTTIIEQHEDIFHLFEVLL